jgi:hypothetical protein
MASDISLADFANKPVFLKAWIDDLPDVIFNQVWDGIHDTLGKNTITAWLVSIGYVDATAGRVETVKTRERRQS